MSHINLNYMEVNILRWRSKAWQQAARSRGESSNPDPVLNTVINCVEKADKILFKKYSAHLMFSRMNV